VDVLLQGHKTLVSVDLVEFEMWGFVAMSSINGNSVNSGFMMQPNPAQPLPYPGSSSGSATSGLSPYFSGTPMASTDTFQSANLLGLPDSGAQAGNDMTTLARFQGLAKKLDIQVNAQEDNKIDVNDLTEALHDTTTKYTSEDKQVIQSILDNTGGIRGKLDHLDGQDDGVMSIENINKMLVNPNVQVEKPEDKMSNTKALSILLESHKDIFNNRIDRNFLQKLADNDKAPEELKLAAKKLLDNKELFKAVDTADKHGDPDGKISMNDIKAAINDPDIDAKGRSESSGLSTPSQPLF
jgi:hypothetical protein